MFKYCANHAPVLLCQMLWINPGYWVIIQGHEKSYCILLLHRTSLRKIFPEKSRYPEALPQNLQPDTG